MGCNLVPPTLRLIRQFFASYHSQNWWTTLLRLVDLQPRFILARLSKTAANANHSGIVDLSCNRLIVCVVSRCLACRSLIFPRSRMTSGVSYDISLYKESLMIASSRRLYFGLLSLYTLGFGLSHLSTVSPVVTILFTVVS